jgi:hypothetical protein
MSGTCSLNLDSSVIFYLQPNLEVGADMLFPFFQTPSRLAEINSISSQNFDAPCNDMSTVPDLDPWINLFQQPGTFDTGFLKPIANMSAEYGGTRSATSDNAVSKGTNPVFDTVPTVNNDHGSAAHAGFDGEILEKIDLKLDTVPVSATDHQSAILACSGGEIWKDRFPVLDGVSPLTIHKHLSARAHHHLWRFHHHT